MFMDADYAVPIETVASGLAAMLPGMTSPWDRGPGRIPRDPFPGRPASVLLAASTVEPTRPAGPGVHGYPMRVQIFQAAGGPPAFARQQLHSVIFDAEILCLAHKQGLKVAEFRCSGATWKIRVSNTTSLAKSCSFSRSFTVSAGCTVAAAECQGRPLARISEPRRGCQRKPPLETIGPGTGRKTWTGSRR